MQQPSVREFIKYFGPGSFFAEDYETEGKFGDVPAALEKLPSHAYQFQFFRVETHGHDCCDLKTTKILDKSPRYFIGKKYTIAELEAKFPHERILISNIKSNGYLGAVHCRTDNWQGLEAGDIVLSG